LKGLLVVTHTAASGARSGIQSVARGLARDDGWVPVAWSRRKGHFHSLPTEWRKRFDGGTASKWLPAKVLRRPEVWIAALTASGRNYRMPLDLHPDFAGRLRGRWLVFPELFEAHVFRAMADWGRKRGMLTAVIFHDAIPVLRPDLTERTAEVHAEYQRALAEADVVLPVSEFSACCLRDFWEKENIKPARMIVCSLPAENRGVARCRTIKAQKENPAHILCVSTLEPRKNHTLLIEALRRVAEPCVLELVGMSVERHADIEHLVREASAADSRIEWRGPLSGNELRDAYERCDFTVYASYLEGFGLPVLESLWHARPCICHREGVMTENAADGGCLTTDVLDADALAGAIRSLINDDVLRLKLANEAVARPLRDWANYAQGVNDALLVP